MYRNTRQEFSNSVFSIDDPVRTATNKFGCA